MTTTSPTVDEIRDFVIAGHGNLAKVKQMLAVQPVLLNQAYEWGPGDTETALQGAAHVGNREIATFLLAQGAPLDICTAAMLGHIEDVESFLRDDAGTINATGAHGIPLLTHAALSGDATLVTQLHQRGATAGASLALGLAVARGHLEVARWLLEHAAPDLAMKNFQGKTVLEIATESSNAPMVDLLRQHGAA